MLLVTKSEDYNHNELSAAIAKLKFILKGDNDNPKSFNEVVSFMNTTGARTKNLLSLIVDTSFVQVCLPFAFRNNVSLERVRELSPEQIHDHITGEASEIMIWRIDGNLSREQGMPEPVYRNVFTGDVAGLTELLVDKDLRSIYEADQCEYVDRLEQYMDEFYATEREMKGRELFEKAISSIFSKISEKLPESLKKDLNDLKEEIGEAAQVKSNLEDAEEIDIDTDKRFTRLKSAKSSNQIDRVRFNVEAQVQFPDGGKGFFPEGAIMPVKAFESLYIVKE